MSIGNRLQKVQFKVFDPIFNHIPYPIASGIVRAIKTGVSIIIAGIFASIADGSIISGFSFIPKEYFPMVLSGLTVFFVGVDKWLREHDLEDPGLGEVEPVTSGNPEG